MLVQHPLFLDLVLPMLAVAVVLVINKPLVLEVRVVVGLGLKRHRVLGPQLEAGL